MNMIERLDVLRFAEISLISMGFELLIEYLVAYKVSTISAKLICSENPAERSSLLI